MLFAHGSGSGGTTSVVHELAPLPVILLVLVGLSGLLLFVRGLGRSAPGLSYQLLAGAILLILPAVTFGRLAYRDRTVVEQAKAESPVPTDVTGGEPATIRFTTATDGGHVHLQAHNPTKLAINLDCQIHALDAQSSPATADDPSLEAPVLLRPGDTKVLNTRLKIERPVVRVDASCERAPFSRKQRAQLDREGIPHW